MVSVPDQDRLVELFGAADRHHVVGFGRGGRQRVEAGVGLVDELVQQHLAKALLGARVPGEQSAFDHLREVAEREDRAVEGGEVAAEGGSFGGGDCRPRVYWHCLCPRSAPTSVWSVRA